MLDLHSARVWLVLVPLLGCRPGGDEVGADEVGESGTGDGDGESGSSESGSSESGTSESESGETETTAETGTTDETETSTGTETDTTDETTDTTGETETTDTTGDGDGDNTCMADADCVLVDDCCNCLATPIGQVPPCDVPECFAPTCEAELGGFNPQAECRVGTCQLSQLGCDLDQIVCLQPPPPPCQPGLVRSVVNDCWGPCVQPSMCEALFSECDASTCGDGFACLTSQGGEPSQCIPLPPDCGGVASCDCVAPWFDEVCDASCGEADGTLICEDGG